MCGRFALASDPDALLRFIELVSSLGILAELDLRALPPRFNIAPTQRVVVLSQRQGSLRLESMRWGIAPPWKPQGPPIINARAESVAEKSFFKKALAERRCLVLADGFYEWLREGRRMRPFLFRRQDRAVFAFAALHDTAEPRPDAPSSCAILTGPAGPLMAPIHDRMPLLLGTGGARCWLEKAPSLPADLPTLLTAEQELERLEVGDRVGKAQNDDPSCQEPASAGASTQTSLFGGPER